MTEIDYGRLDALEAILGGRAAIEAMYRNGQTFSGGSGIDGVTVTGTPSTGQIITATSASAADWQTPSGGSGWTPPGPVHEIDFFDGTNPADSGMIQDGVNEGAGWVGLYPKAGATEAGFSVYDNHVAPDGTVTPGTDPSSTLMGSRQVGVNKVVGAAYGKLVLSDGPSGHPEQSYPQLEMKPNGVPTPGARVIGVYDASGQPIHYLNWDGSLWVNGGSWFVSASGYEAAFHHETEPADDDIQPGQVFSWFDATNGAAFYRRKGKTLDGTIVRVNSAMA